LRRSPEFCDIKIFFVAVVGKKLRRIGHCGIHNLSMTAEVDIYWQREPLL
jgi:hypothetical protein